ncbi:MAG: transposase [Tannerella sp.]|nr:transposase [Tannerella sp.]
MYRTKTHRVDDRIVSIHQPHIRPIVRGKSKADVEFGAKIHLSLIDGVCFLDELSWDTFNEGSHPEVYIEQYRRRFGFYPAEVLADKIYCTRDNRKLLKGKGIHLKAKPPGRPSASAVSNHVSPRERNPVEGKFGQAKTAYGLDRIRARLRETSESWIAGIIPVLNLVKLAGAIALCTIIKVWLSFSALQEKPVNFDCRTINQQTFLSAV